MNPILLIVAGPNGSGKTTVTERLQKDRWSEDVEYLNPDDVAQQRFGDWNSPEAVVKAANWVTQRREELLSNKQSMAFETVFSAPDKVEFLSRAIQAGYFTRVFFVSTIDPRINTARVAGRIMAGGHGVPIEKIISRYTKSMTNLAAAIALANRVYIYDNSQENVEARLCARTEDGQLRKIYTDLPAWVESAIAGLPHHPDFQDLHSE